MLVRFQQVCERAYMIIRSQGALLIRLFMMMLSAGIPQLTNVSDVSYLKETLALDLGEDEARKKFTDKFKEAKNKSWSTSVNWAIHNMAHKWRLHYSIGKGTGKSSVHCSYGARLTMFRDTVFCTKKCAWGNEQTFATKFHFHISQKFSQMNCGIAVTVMLKIRQSLLCVLCSEALVIKASVYQNIVNKLQFCI